MTKVRSVSDDRDPLVTEQLPSNTAGFDVIAADPFSAVVSVGTVLRQAREATGLHIAALSASLKVPVKKLEALEDDRFDLLPDAVFVRALASSICRNLKIDPAPILERLPQTGSLQLAHQGRGINTPFRASGEGPRHSMWAQVSRPSVLAGLVLVLGALVLVLLPVLKTGVGINNQRINLTTTNTQPAVSVVAEEVVSAGASAPRPVVSSVPLSSSGAGQASVAAQSSSSSSSSASASALLQASAASAGLASPALPVTTAGTVVFTAKGVSWVEVTDAKGIVVLRRTLNSGEVVAASGALPLAAVVGKADAMQVHIRGNAFDLIAVAKDNVARFEVK